MRNRHDFNLLPFILVAGLLVGCIFGGLARMFVPPEMNVPQLSR